MKRKQTRIRVGVAFLEERLGKHRNTLRRWVDNDKFPKPSYDPSGYRSWFLDEIEEWEAENYSSTNPQTLNVDAALAARRTATTT